LSASLRLSRRGATALIIYYKQISEGYEDRERFQIMEKIGMSQSEVKTSIHRQILLVFFMPLVVAGVHVAVAFQMLLKMLKLLLLSSTWAFAGCAVGAFAVFSIVYAAIYMATARTYYRIVK
jgi:putative ABC transport system permease protein